MMLTTTTKESADLNYLKNRGEPQQWFHHKGDYVEDKPIPRIRIGGFEIAEKSKATIGELIVPNKYDVYKPVDIHVRLTNDDARKVAEKMNFQQDKWFDFAGNLSYKPPQAPRKLKTQTAKDIAETNWQERSSDWYYHNRPQSTASFKTVNKCVGTHAQEIKEKMISSNASEWFRTWSLKDARNLSSAPSSPKTRVKYEGKHYALRARGIGAEMLMHSNEYDQDYDESAIPYRCNTVEAGEICRNQTTGGSMARCLGNKFGMSDRSERPQDRVQNDEAREYLSRGRTGTMHLSVDGTSMSIQPKVRPEAEEYYIRGRGNVGSVMNQYENKGYSSPQPAARIVSTEARKAFETNKGVMSSIVGKTSYRPPVYKTKNPVRGIIGSEAKEFMQKSIGSSMKQLVENYKLQGDPPPKQRTGASGWQEGGLMRTASVGNLLTDYGKKTAPEVPPLRLYGAGVEVADKHRAKDFFKTIQQNPPSA